MHRVAFELPNHSGLPLRGDVRSPLGDGVLPTVVVCHGFKGFKDWGFFPYIGERLAVAGFLAVCFNFSGSGIGADFQNFTELDRFAEDTMSAQVGDLACVLDALEAGELGEGRADVGRLGVLGHSRGGATALLTAREDARVRAVVTWASISTLERYSEEELAKWKERGYAEVLNARTGQTMRMNYSLVEDYLAHRERLDVIGAAGALQAPLLLVHGDADDSVPVDEARVLHAAAHRDRTSLAVLPGAGHTFGAVHPWKSTTPELETAIALSLDWFRTHLDRRPA